MIIPEQEITKNITVTSSSDDGLSTLAKTFADLPKGTYVFTLIEQVNTFCEKIISK